MSSGAFSSASSRCPRARDRPRGPMGRTRSRMSDAVHRSPESRTLSRSRPTRPSFATARKYRRTGRKSNRKLGASLPPNPDFSAPRAGFEPATNRLTAATRRLAARDSARKLPKRPKSGSSARPEIRRTSARSWEEHADQTRTRTAGAASVFLSPVSRKTCQSPHRSRTERALEGAEKASSALRFFASPNRGPHLVRISDFAA